MSGPPREGWVLLEMLSTQSMIRAGRRFWCAPDEAKRLVVLKMARRVKEPGSWPPARGGL